MFLLRLKTRGKSIQHPLGKIPGADKLSDQRKLELLTLIREGNASASDELVKGHIRLVIYIASRYAALKPHKAHDLVSEGITELIRCSRNIGEMYNDNFTAWLVARVHTVLADFVRRDQMIPVPQGTAVRKSKDGEPIQRPNRVFRFEHPTSRRSSLLELRDMLDSIITTEFEREVVNLRSQYFNDREISEKLGVSKDSVTKARRNLEQRFEALEMQA